MANAILTPTMITREALRILHQKCSFLGSVHREYDDRFARSGAKIGDTLQIRKPARYTVRTGATLSAQDHTETKVDLPVQTQVGVDVNFTSVELTLDLDDFSKRVLQPAMAQLAAHIENDVMSNLYKDVYNLVDNAGSAATFAKLLEANKAITDNLAPRDQRCVQLNTQDNVDLVDALKGLFQDSSSIARQYREGYMGRTAGFGEIFENTLVPSHTIGAHGGTPLVNGASQTGATLVTDGWTASTAVLKAGDVFTIAGVNRVHKETRQDTGELQKFVVTADGSSDGTGNLTISISPSITTSGAFQTVTASPADNAAITVLGTASATQQQSLAYHKDAFAFATADLVMPEGVDFSAREVMDGVSMRIVRQYDINNDKFPTRVDILYGYTSLYPELAARLWNN